MSAERSGGNLQNYIPTDIEWWEGLLMVPFPEMMFELFMATLFNAFISLFLLGTWWFSCQAFVSNVLLRYELREDSRQIAEEIIAERVRRNAEE